MIRAAIRPAFLLLFCIVFTSVGQLHNAHNNNIVKQYHLQNASAGSDAVKEAVKFFRSQNSPSKIETASITHLTLDSYTNYINSQHNSLPLCSVTFNDIIASGMFLYHDIPPPYTECYARRSRYHVAPLCGQQELAKSLIPIHQWHWTLKSAYAGKCRMPSTNIFHSAASYIENHKQRSDTVTILMLGLSFMAQPYLSLICLNQHHVDADASYLYMNNERIVLRDIIKDGGQCTGATLQDIPQYYQPNIHGNNYSLPKQHHSICSMHHSIVQFRPPALSDAPKIRVCYVYSFNLEKNLKPHSSLPCNLTWDEVDVIFGLHKNEEMLRYYLPRTGASPTSLSHVTYVNVAKIYQGTLMTQLRTAYAAYGFKDIDISNAQAKPMSCERADIHYRLPGITDFAAQIWLQLLGYGLPARWHYIDRIIRVMPKEQGL